LPGISEYRVRRTTLARIADELLDAALVMLLHRILKIEVVLDREVKKSVEAVGAAHLRRLLDVFALVMLARAIGDLQDFDPMPTAGDQMRPLEAFAQGTPELEIRIDLLLPLDRLVAERSDDSLKRPATTGCRKKYFEARSRERSKNCHGDAPIVIHALVRHTTNRPATGSVLEQKACNTLNQSKAINVIRHYTVAFAALSLLAWSISNVCYSVDALGQQKSTDSNAQSSNGSEHFFIIVLENQGFETAFGKNSPRAVPFS
jgi:hypothetical protein